MYDLTKPHLRIVAKNQPAMIVQNGVAFEHGSRRSLGPVHEMLKDRVMGKHDYKLCRECGGTFTSVEGLQEHVLKSHHDVIMARVMKDAPKGIKGIWTPDQDMLDAAAQELVAEAADEQQEQKTDGSAAKGGKPKSWRESK